MINISELKFDEKGLIPAIVVDEDTKKVLTLAYMNEESLKISMEKKLTCFWSRSRQELWLKGETSGNYQHIVSITADCDKDALVVMVHPDGPACHLGTFSCFENPVWEDEDLCRERSQTVPMKAFPSTAFTTSFSEEKKICPKAPIPHTSLKRGSTRS